ncbi:MAG: DUF2167 domain-containing protein [Hyphomonadaceae bacterium]
MLTKLTRAIAAAIVLTFAAPAYADGPGDAGPDVAAPPVRAAPQPAPTAEPAADAAGRSGVIPLSNDELSLNIPDGYLFYGPEQARAFLQRNGAAAPNGSVLGVIARADANLNAPGTWATVLSYDAIGYVQPETAAGLSDPNFEDTVRAARNDQNRPFEGFMVAPDFDASVANLVWAERAAAPGSQGADLRAEQKVLGRYGVACLTSIGSADQMPEITNVAGALIRMVSFPEGRRYTDFQPASDEVSAFSVPGLVTGVAEPQATAESASTGQTAFGGFAGYFPWIALGVVVLAGAGYMLMRRRRNDDDAEDAELTDA